MIARPKISRNEWNTAERGAFEVGHVALFSCPGDHQDLVRVGLVGHEAPRVVEVAVEHARRVPVVLVEDVVPAQHQDERVVDAVAFRVVPRERHGRVAVPQLGEGVPVQRVLAGRPQHRAVPRPERLRRVRHLRVRRFRVRARPRRRERVDGVARAPEHLEEAHVGLVDDALVPHAQGAARAAHVLAPDVAERLAAQHDGDARRRRRPVGPEEVLGALPALLPVDPGERAREQGCREHESRHHRDQPMRCIIEGAQDIEAWTTSTRCAHKW